MNTQYDFAFSFAGEDRKLVEEIKAGLKGYKIFYDNDFQSELCGKDLYSHLRNLYMKQTRYVVCFISKYYKLKVWTNLEFTAIKERLMATFFASDFLIPIIIDDESCPEDIPSFMGFYKHKCIEETIQLIDKKYKESLNEDFRLDNIKHFGEYVLQELMSRFNAKGLKAEHNDNYMSFYSGSGQKIVYLLPEDFTNLPCLLLYENKMDSPPTAMITWQHGKRILFSWSPFTILSENLYEDISLDELLSKIEYYLINNQW